MPSQNLSRETIGPLLDLLRDPESEVRLAAFDVCTRLPLNKKAWRAVADAANRLLDEFPPGSPERHAIIKLSVRIPLLSFRTHLREMAAKPDELDRDVVVEALASAADPSQIGWVLEQIKLGGIEWFESLAAMPLESQNVKPRDIPTVKQEDNSSSRDARFWRSLALARLGEYKPLKRFLRGKEDEPSIFGGDPWTPFTRIAHIRPIPEKMRIHLLSDYDPTDQSTSIIDTIFDRVASFFLKGEIHHITDSHKIRNIVVEALTGELNAEGYRSVPDEVGESHDVASEANGKADQPQGEPTSIPDEFSIEEVDPLLLSRLPAERVPEIVLEILNQADRKATEATAQEHPEGAVFVGNRVIELVAALPSVPDWPVAGLARSWLDAQTSALDDQQFAWIIAQAPLDHAISEFNLFLADGSPTERLPLLEIIGLVADVYSGRAGSPYRGAGTGGETASFVQELIDDQLPEAGPPDVNTLSYGPKSAKRVVRTGFADKKTGGNETSIFKPLQTGCEYYFWFDQGLHDPTKSMETTPTRLPTLPSESRLTVVLFSNAGQIEILEHSNSGEMMVQEDGSLQVMRQPLENLPKNLPLVESRLYFPVRIPDEPGRYRMRCNVYHEQFLLQSRLITVQAVAETDPQESEERRLRSDLDYTVANDLSPSYLNELAEVPHALSLMLNQNDDGTHAIYVKDQESPFSVWFTEGELRTFIIDARKNLENATFARDGKGNQVQAYKYSSDLEVLKNDLKNDLLEMAKSGYAFYDMMMSRLDKDRAESLEELLITPKIIQVAHKYSPKYLLPAALIYDLPLYRQAHDSKKYHLCPHFEDSLLNNGSLANSICFTKGCPERDDVFSICPSGFWGFRHILGMPLSIDESTHSEQESKKGHSYSRNMPTKMEYDAPLRFAIGLSRDFDKDGAHRQALKELLLKPYEWKEADELYEVIDLLKNPPHVLYFFCHGSVDEKGTPTLWLMSPEGKDVIIDATIFRAFHIDWNNISTPPLVIMNGCHTTAVTPDQILDFVTPVMRLGGAGVIGTEVTIFPLLATAFAEEFFQNFLNGTPIGEAVRLARLGLLSKRNPLGLVYIPFVYGGLTLTGQ